VLSDSTATASPAAALVAARPVWLRTRALPWVVAGALAFGLAGAVAWNLR
jgi:hypothetical protein